MMRSSCVQNPVRLIKRMGAGTLDGIRRGVDASLPEPEFEVSDGFLTAIRRNTTDETIPSKKAGEVTGEVTDQVTEKPACLSTCNIVNIINTYNMCMAATKRIPVSEGVWAEISELKYPGQTFDDLLSSMAEQEKKRRFIEDMDRIEANGDFVELDFDASDTD